MRGLMLGAVCWCMLVGTIPLGYAAAPDVAPEHPGKPLAIELPEDSGAHDDTQTEWWYVTGWLADGEHPVGFQITFFRSRLPGDRSNPSAFAPKQAIFAHAAISDPRLHHVLFAQRSARAGFGLASAASGHTQVRLGRWSLSQARDSADFEASIEDPAVAMTLTLHQTQAVLLEGEEGVSKKGPSAAAQSDYYSLPQLRVSGHIRLLGAWREVHGEAWLDHEWSNSYLDRNAQGWDWVGANLADGGALMAFRMRSTSGATLWAGATRREANGTTRHFSPDEVAFSALQTWQSDKTGVQYPVSQQVRVGAEQFLLKPLMLDQEIDATNSTATRYWEGAVELDLPTGQPAGRGYLELTGYGDRLRLD